MRITTDASQIDLSPSRSARETAPGAGSGTGISGSAAGADRIALSGISELVQQAQNAGSDDRAARVKELRQQIDSNQFEIDPLAVSQALINSSLAGE
jgi:anti-sigma28 factor (negative regulator of flagellin synthesis)